jgi:hypothetical protein
VPIGTPARQLPTLSKRQATRSHVPGATVIAFEQCTLSPLTPRDNDTNDFVFEVTAEASIDKTTGEWLDYTLLLQPLAIGSTDDFALDVRFDDIGLPVGSRVHLIRLGAEPLDDCFTVNSVHDETAACPSMSTVRLFRSVRAALPAPSTAHQAPYINTLRDQPHQLAAHTAMLTILPPPGTPRPLNLRLDFELRTRNVVPSKTCVVRSNLLRSDGTGYAVVVPAPFAWPLEGVPAFLAEGTRGICVGGDEAANACSERQECPNGYCILDEASDQRYRCYDSPNAGENPYTSCARISQCPYGSCYGYAGSNQHGAYPTLATWRQCAKLGCYGADANSTAACVVMQCQSRAVTHWYQERSMASSNELYLQH